MKAFTTILAVAVAAIGISSVTAKAVPQEAIELPASLLTERTIERLRPCWDAPDDSIHCTKAKREVERLRPCWDAPDDSIQFTNANRQVNKHKPCWDAPDDSIHCPKAKREVERLRHCWQAPDDSIHCPKVKREAEADGEFLGQCWRQPDDSIHCPVSKRDADGGYCFVDFEGVKQCVNKTKNELRDSTPAADEDPLFSFGCFYADCELCPLARHDCKTGAIIPFDGIEDPPTVSTDNGNVLDTLAKRGDCFYIYGGVVCPKLKRVDGKSATCSSSPNFAASGHREGRKEGGLLAQFPFPSPFSSRRSRLGRRDEGNYTATLDPGEGNVTATIDPGDVSMGLTLPGTFSPCGKWYLVTGADHVSGCAGIAALYGLSSESLRALNPDINAGCTNLRLGYRYCLAPAADTALNSTASTSASSSSFTAAAASTLLPPSASETYSADLMPSPSQVSSNDTMAQPDLMCRMGKKRGCAPAAAQSVAAASSAVAKRPLGPAIRPTGIPHSS